jgi:hypothetical protein
VASESTWTLAQDDVKQSTRVGPSDGRAIAMRDV